VQVFIDWQNAYYSARETFHGPLQPGRVGSFDPRRLAELIVRMRAVPSVLAGVSVYRGLPWPERDPETHRCASEDAERWRSRGVNVVSLPLCYPSARSGRKKPVEKGIDVALAVDLVEGAVRGAFDVAVLMSNDQDFRHAIEQAQVAGVIVESAGWATRDTMERRLRFDGLDLAFHRLDEKTYRAVRADRDQWRPAA
jgi:hypothetical protein